jgi:hypothetical protein
MSDDPFEKWREARKEYFSDSTYMDRKKRFHEWMVSMWKAGHMPEEIRDIWVHDYIGKPQDKGGRAPRVTSRPVCPASVEQRPQRPY